MRRRAEQYSVILSAGDKRATGFFVHADGLIVTCFHLLEEIFGSRGVRVGQRLGYQSLDGKINGWATVTAALDPANDAALLQIEGEFPEGMQVLPLISTEAIEHTPFVLSGYAEPDASAHRYRKFTADGVVIDRSDRMDGSSVLVLDSKRIFRGLSGGAIYCASLGGAVGMQSERLNPPGTWGTNTAFACPSEALAALNPNKLRVMPPPPPDLTTQAETFIENISAQSLTIVAGNLVLTRSWVRPNEFDFQQRRWLRAVPREVQLDGLHRLIGVEQSLVRCVALVGDRGVGKSTLASIYVQRYGGEYPGGVLWAEIGVDFEPQRDGLPLLLRWASYAYGGMSVSPALKQQVIHDSLFVQTALGGANEEMLVVFNDVIHADQIMALLNALPANANILVTGVGTALGTLIGGMEFETFELRGFDAEDARTLIANRLPNLSADDLQALVELFSGQPQALVSVAADLAQRGDTTAVLRSLLAGDAPIEPVRAAFQLNYDALPDDEHRRCLRLLGILADVEGDFGVEIVCVIWDVAAHQAEQVLHVLAERAWLHMTTKEGDRWSMSNLVREYVRSLLVDDEERFGAAARYLDMVTALGRDSAVWTTDEPEIAHLVFVGHVLVERAEGQLSENGEESLATDVIEAFTPTLLYLAASLSYLVMRPQAYDYAERWMTVYCGLAFRSGEAIAAGWGYYSLARWNLLSERHSEALEALAQAETIGREYDLPALIGYVLMDRAIIYRLNGQNNEAISSFEAVLELHDDEEDPLLRTTVLLGLASVYLTIAKIDQAAVYLEHARAVVEENGLQDDYIMLNLAQLSAGLMINRSQVGEAIQLLLQARESAERLQDERMLAEVNCNLGWAYFQLGEHEAAARCLEEAKRRAMELPYPRLMPTILAYNAALYNASGASEQAQTLLHEALDLATQPELSDPNLEAQIRALLGETYYRRGQPKLALPMLQSALDRLGDLKNTTTAVNTLNLIGTIFRETSQIEEGLRYFQEKQEQIRSLNNDGANVTLFNWLAILLSDVGNAREAMNYFERAQPLIDRLENDEEQATTRVLSAMLYRVSGELDRAYTELQKAEAIWLKLHNAQRRAEVLVTMAEIALVRGRLEETESCLEDIQLIAEASDYTPLQAGYYSLRGMLAFHAQQFSEAHNMFERSADINKVLDNPILRISNLNNLALLSFFDRQDLDRAEQRLNEALTLAREVDFAPHIAMVLSNLGLIKFVRGQVEDAAACLDQAADTLREGGMTADSAGQTVDMLQMLAHAFRQPGFSADPRETLRLLLTAVSWESVAFILRARAQTLLLPETDDILRASIADALHNGQTLLVGAMRSIQQLIDDCRREGVDETVSRMARRFVSTDMDRWYAYLQRANRNYHTALIHINQVLKMLPNDVEALVERGWIQRGLGRLDAAHADFERAETLDRRQHKAFIGLGVVAYEQGKLDQAALDLTRAITQVPDDAYAYQWRSAVFQALGVHEKALADLNAAIEIEPRVSSHRYWRALNALATRRLEDALNDLTAVVEMDQGNDALLAFDYFWLGLVYAQREDKRGARFHWERGVGLAGSEPWSMLLYKFVKEDDDTLIESLKLLLQRMAIPHILVTQRHHWHMLCALSEEPRRSVAAQVLEIMAESFVSHE